MAVTFTDNGTNTPNGTHKEFGYTFPTIKTDGTDVKVALNGQTQATSKYAVNTTNTKITFNNTSIDSALQESDGAPKTGVVVRVYRDTLLEDADTVTFVAGSSIRAQDLNANFNQSRYALQEEQTNTINSEDITDGAVTYAKIQDVSATDRVLGRDSSGAGVVEEIAPAALRTMINVEDGATADQSNAEIRAAVEAASDSNVFTDADHTKLNAIEANATADQTASEIKSLIASSPLDSSHLAADSVSTSAISDAELTTLAGMQSGTASILAGSTALTATLAEINTVVDGKSVETTISDTDAAYPTSGAVVDYVAAQIAPIGGLEVIANKDSFPETQPAAGVVISIADAAGIVVNGSGTSTTPDTISSDATVTINNINSSFNSSTVASGVGWLVTSTGSGQIYNYHKANIKESDVVQLSDDINDFNSRYRTATNRTADGDSSNDEGDLFFDQTTNKMYVHDGSSWGEVTSVGDYKLLTVVPDGASSGSPDYTNLSFDLRDGGNAASITSVGQLLVSVNGVLQKPNSTSWSASNEGFHLEGTNGIKFCTAPGSGASVFVTQIGSATTVNTPATNSVVEAAIQTNVVSEEKLKISNAGSNGQFLSKQSGNSGGLTWADVPAGVGGATGVDFNDDVKVRFGTGNDTELLHNGTDFQFISTNDASDFEFIAKEVNGTTANHTLAKFYSDTDGTETGASLYYGNNEQLRTGNTRVEVQALTTGNFDQHLVLYTGTNSAASARIEVRKENTNADIYINPIGTGKAIFGSHNTDIAITTNGTGDLTLSTNSGTDSGTIEIEDGANNDIVITPNGSGDVIIDGLKYPQADGSANQVLTTNGSAQLSWADASGGGAVGGGSDKIFMENGQTVTTNYTIGTEFGAACNALSAGPITINNGITVTIDSGDNWTIV